MGNIIVIIKIWAIIQLIIIFIFIIFFNITRIWLQYKLKKRDKTIANINHLLTKSIDDPTYLSNPVIKFFNQKIMEFLLCFDKTEKENQENKNWEKIKIIISDYILKPQAKLLAFSSYWFKRYLATRCYRIGLNIADEKILLKLLKDEVLIVSVNAAMLIFNNPSSIAINKVIDVITKERRMLRLTLANILIDQPIKNDAAIKDILIKRLYIEKNNYARITCYEILSLLKPSEKIDPIVENDLLTNDIDIRIAVLVYLSHVDTIRSKAILLNYLNDPSYAVRTRVATLLGKLGDRSVIPYLKSKLSDKAWWVRINSANALVNLGKEGMIALESVSPKEDRFAYETAQAFLKIHQNLERK